MKTVSPQKPVVDEKTVRAQVKVYNLTDNFKSLRCLEGFRNIVYKINVDCVALHILRNAKYSMESLNSIFTSQFT